MNIVVPEIYKKLWTTTKPNIVCVSGRSAGKSKQISDFININGLMDGVNDVVVCRGTTASMKDSIRNEIISSINDLQIRVNVLSSPHPITNLDNGNKIYFLGIDGDEGERVKGFRPLRKIKYIVLEELRDVSTKLVYDQAIITLSKHLAEDGKILILYNPKMKSSHWLNKEQVKWNKNEGYEVIRPTYKDVWKFLSPRLKQEIIECKESDEDYHDWLYLGKVRDNYKVLFRNPNKNGKVENLYDCDLHIDASYGGSDGTAITLYKKKDGKITALGKLLQKSVDECYEDILELCKRYRVKKIHMEKNADKGFAIRELEKLLKGVVGQFNLYHESMNKVIKISTHLKKEWASIEWINTTDKEYLEQITDWDEDADHDDAPDSIASIIREANKIWELRTLEQAGFRSI